MSEINIPSPARWREGKMALLTLEELIERWRKQASLAVASGLTQAANELEQQLTLFEDELAVNISQADYDEWFAQSKLDGVRTGPRMRRTYDQP